MNGSIFLLCVNLHTSMLVALEVILPIFFIQIMDKRAQSCYLIEHIFFYRTVFFNIITTISYAFFPALIKSLHTMLVKIDTSRTDQQVHSCYDGVIAKKMLPCSLFFTGLTTSGKINLKHIIKCYSNSS